MLLLAQPAHKGRADKYKRINKPAKMAKASKPKGHCNQSRASNLLSPANDTPKSKYSRGAAQHKPAPKALKSAAPSPNHKRRPESALLGGMVVIFKTGKIVIIQGIPASLRIWVTKVIDGRLLRGGRQNKIPTIIKAYPIHLPIAEQILIDCLYGGIGVALVFCQAHFSHICRIAGHPTHTVQPKLRSTMLPVRIIGLTLLI